MSMLDKVKRRSTAASVRAAITQLKYELATADPERPRHIAHLRRRLAELQATCDKLELADVAEAVTSKAAK